MIIEVRQDIVLFCVREIERRLGRKRKRGKEGRKESGASPSAINIQ